MSGQNPVQAARMAIAVANSVLLGKALQSGADANARDPSGATLLHSVASEPDGVALIKTLVAHGAKLDATDGAGRTALYLAVNAQQIDNVRALLEAGADANVVVRKDQTHALFRAIYIGRADIALALLPHTTDVNLEAPDDGGTPLLWAVATDSVELVRALQERGAHIHAPGVLQSAAFNGRREHIEYLLSQGADINARNRHGATCLHVAAGRGRDELVSWLLARGADRALRDADGKLPVDWAISQERGSTAELLRG